MVAYRFFIAAVYLVCSSIIPLHAGWFSSHKYEQEELLELTPKKKQSSFSIDHTLPGTIQIKGWHQEHIAVTVHKKTHHADDAERVACTLTQTTHGVITLKVKASDNVYKHAAVDLTIHLPHQTPMTIIAQENVLIEHTGNSVRVQTEEGNITAATTRGPLHLETKKGDIAIDDATNTVTAYTDRGNITIDESHNSITAETMRGSIVATCAEVPSTAFIALTSNRKGTITVTLPETTEARLIADTTRDVINSDMLITLERHTTLLNAHAYKDAQQHIRGIIGQNGAAEIKLTSAGTIYIAPADII